MWVLAGCCVDPLRPPPFEGSYRTAGMIRWPGKVPAGVVTNEMLGAIDWLPTLAGMVGASDLVPKDRPIDGVDASAFMLGISGKFFLSDWTVARSHANTVLVITASKLTM